MPNVKKPSKRIKHALKQIYHKGHRFAMKVLDTKTAESKLKYVDSPVMLTKTQMSEIDNFWTKYGIRMKYAWHQFYYAYSGVFSAEYIGEDVFQHDIKPVFNNSTFASVWSDKAYLDFFLQGTKTATTVLRNINGHFVDQSFQMITKEQAEQILQNYEKLVIKPTLMTSKGKGVELLTKPYHLEQISNEYKKNYIFQIPVVQHPFMSKLNPSSVNCIRVNTVLIDHEVYIMSAFVKIGQTGAFADNEGNKRFFLGITSDGHFMPYAINRELKKFDRIPSGFAFSGVEFPFCDEVRRVVTQAHKCIPHLGFAFWDIAINSEGEPVIIEVNLRKPVAYIAQAACGPMFGPYTKLVMDHYAQIKNG